MPELATSKNNPSVALLGLLLAFLVVVLDQGSKYWVTAVFEYGERYEVLPIFNLTLVHNHGAAFSFLSDAGGWQRWFFTVMALGVSCYLVVWLMRLSPQQKIQSVAIGLILGGAVGNLWDRVVLGYVVDFIDVHWKHHHWPVFNIADSAITLGAIGLLYDSFCHPVVNQESQQEK